MMRPRQEVAVELIAAEIIQRAMGFRAVEGGLVHQMGDDLARLRDLLPEFGNVSVSHGLAPALCPCPSIGSAFGLAGKQHAFSRLLALFMPIPAPWRSTSRFAA